MAREKAKMTDNQTKSDNKTSHKTCVIADCINRIDNCPELCIHEFPKDGKLCKKLEKLARRADKEFYKNRFRFACSEHFLLTNYRRSLTGRRILILVSSVFKARKNTIDTVEESHRVKRFKAANAKSSFIPPTTCSATSATLVQEVQPDKEVNSETTESLKTLIKDLESQIETLQLEVEGLRKDVAVPRFTHERFSTSSEDMPFILASQITRLSLFFGRR